jgi:hypothetical protein
MRVSGIIAIKKGSISSGRRMLGSALRIAQNQDVLLLQAEVLEELSTLEKLGGRQSISLRHRRRAQLLYRRVGAIDRAAALGEVDEHGERG